MARIWNKHKQTPFDYAQGKNTPLKRKVFVGLSGGVDSAVSAALLKERGFDVTGVFIKVWQPDFLPCTWREERRDAMRVAVALDIPFLFFDFSDEYKRGVVDKIILEYKAGRTPNPDILCNREIKFGAFWHEAKKHGADYIATGHYARNEDRKLKMGIDLEKDQSYFLWTLTAEDLERALFPIGHLEKREVRKLAHKYNLPVAEKKDSQGICFIGQVSMDEFLSHFISTKRGRVLNARGEVIGSHKGATFYTIGERHGFEILNKSSREDPFYVISKDIKANTITVSAKEAEIVSFSPIKILVKNVNWVRRPESRGLVAKIRYRGEMSPVVITKQISDGLELEFKKPMKGLSFGQSIVFYSRDLCLGGGVMDRAII